jgi:septation ring formation regulator EzrA
MTQICANIDPELYDVIMDMSDERELPKGKIAAELIEYGINRPDADYVTRLEKELEMKDELIKHLEEEIGFLRTSYSTLENQIAAPLTRLLPEVTQTRRSLLDRLLGRRKEEEVKK